MQKYARMGVIGGTVALLALAAVAFAVAAGDSGAPPRDNLTLEATDPATPTSAPETDAPTATLNLTPAATPLDDEDDGEEPAGNEGQGDGPERETTTALNPAGHCVELPNTSDVIQDPEQHDNWTITDCDPQDEGPDGDGDDPTETPEPQETDDGDDDDGASELVPATNPGGQCTQIAADSDVVRHPDKHPGWTLGECEDSGD
jgi:hypothetical protein